MGTLNYEQGPVHNVPTKAATDSSAAAASTAFVQSVIPTGAVLPFAGPMAPEGWIMCDGSVVSRATYNRLFAVIGVTWGAGDGSTTFTLPDLRGEFVRGLDQGRGVDTGRTLGSSQGGSIQSHSHTYGQAQPVGSGAGATVVSAAASTGFNTATTGGAETRPRNVAMNYIIKFA